MEKRETFAQAISDILIKNKVVSSEVMRGVQEAFGRSSAAEFDDFLLEEGIVRKDDLLAALSDYYEVPSIDVVGEFFDSLLLRNFPLDFLERNAVIPYEEENENMLVVIAANPTRDALERGLRNFCNYDITFMVGLRQDIMDAAREYYDRAPTQTSFSEDVDIDPREEHKDEVEAYDQLLQGEEDAYKDEAEGLSEEDDIRK